MSRPPPRTAFEYANRSWRPSLAWLIIVFVVLPVGLFVAAVLTLVVFGMAKAISTGQPMPDVTAGLDRVLAQIMPYVGPAIATACAGLLRLLSDRTHEVRREITAEGGSSAPPFDASLPPPSGGAPPEPSPTGGLVNNQAIQ